MNVWTITEFPGRWTRNTAAVVVADTAQQAVEILTEELDRLRLPDITITEDQLTLLETNHPLALHPLALVLCDGEP